MRSQAGPAYGRHVALFLVFRNLPGVTRDQYTAAQRAAADASRRSSQAGREVRYLGGFFLTGTGRAICIFQAESASDVAAVNKQAGVPATGIAEAIDLRAGPLESPPDGRQPRPSDHPQPRDPSTNKITAGVQDRPTCVPRPAWPALLSVARAE